jgi:hypothetical protein
MHYALAATPLLFGLGTALCACSSNGGTTPVPVPDAGTGASIPDGSTSKSDDAGTTVADASEPSGDADQRATACTDPPYLPLTVTLNVLDVKGTLLPLAGATVGFSTCPGFDVTTDANGVASANISENVPVSPIYTDGVAILPAIGAELATGGGDAGGSIGLFVELFAEDMASAVPGFRGDAGDQATIAIELSPNSAATGACAGVSGVTFAVTGHPEAIVSYTVNGWPSDPTLGTSSSGAWVFVNGVVGASRVAITATKPGCTVSLSEINSQSGSFLLVPESITYGVAGIDN